MIIEFVTFMKYHSAVKRIHWVPIAVMVSIGWSCGDASPPKSTSSSDSREPAATAKKASPSLATDTVPSAEPVRRSKRVSVRPAAPKPTALPDGVFTGTLTGERLSGEITLVVRDGVLAVSRVEVLAKRRLELTLKTRSAADATALSLLGRKDGSFLEVLGEFLDSERASGTFTGTVFRKRVSGRWYVVRR